MGLEPTEWANDGHPAFDATVTATAIDPEGTPQTPVPMQFEGADGRYSGTITYPSPRSWTVRFTSVSPASTMEIVEEVTAPPATATTTTSAPSTATTTPVDVDVDDTQPEQTAPPAVPDDSGGGVDGVFVAAVLAVVLAVGAVVALRARRSRGGGA